MDVTIPHYESRADVPVEMTWDLSTVFESDAAWEEGAAQIEKLVAEYPTRFKGHLMDSAAALADALEAGEVIDLLRDRLYQYAAFRNHEDTRLSEGQARLDKATRLSVMAGEAMSFMTPEILEGADKIDLFLTEESRLAPFKRTLERIKAQKPHTLSAVGESLLASMGEITSAPDTIFSMLTNADLPRETIKDEQGKEVELNDESYGLYVKSSDRRVRADAFNALHREYRQFRNTLAASYNASVKVATTEARLRGFGSSREMALFHNEVPVSVYDNLIDSVHRGLPVVHRYTQIRAKALGIDDPKYYDYFAPLVNAASRKYTFEEACDLTRRAVAPLGKEYGEVMERCLTERWIDVYPTKGKRGGAYSWGTHTSHPFIMLNYNGTYGDVSTLAHEAGHSLHSYFSHHTQPYADAHYVIFVAEVASTVNETLMAELLLKEAPTRDEKLFLLSQQLETLRSTIHRQTMFAEFERDAHARVESGEGLTADWLEEHYRQLNVQYYGESVGNDEMLKYEWSRIPHFYGAFYVYQYSTGISAATALVDRVLTLGEEGVKDYFNLLRGGRSADPITILRRAGVDMEGDAVDRALATFERKVDQLEELLAQK